MQTITQTGAGVVGATTAYAVKGAELVAGTPPVSLTDAAGREILSLGAVGRPVRFSSPVQALGLISTGAFTKLNIFVE